MPSAYFSNPVIFLIDILFGIYMGIIALRIIMQWAQWEYHNPLVQLIIRATQAPIKLLRRFIPSIGRWDTATFILLFTVALIKLLLIALLQTGIFGLAIILLVLADIFSLFITLFSISIILQVILSWLAPHSDHPVAPLIHSMNNPLLRPIRRWLPPMGGFDLSPLVVLLGLQVLAMLVLPLLTGQI